MKKDIHPDYECVVFRDPGVDFTILTRSTKTSKDTIKWEDGNEYPLVSIEISSASHPFYTGKAKLVDSAGRIEKFNRKYGRKKDAEETAGTETPAEETPTAEAPAEETPAEN